MGQTDGRTPGRHIDPAPHYAGRVNKTATTNRHTAMQCNAIILPVTKQEEALRSITQKRAMQMAQWHSDGE